MMKTRLWQAPALLCAICLCGNARTLAQAQPAQNPEVRTQATASAQPQTAGQEPTPSGALNDGRVALTEIALARGAAGEVLLAGTLRAAPSAGTPESPIQNVRFIVENRSPAQYSYLSGRVTFYDAAGVRCGEGLFTANSLVSGERAEVDGPGLRLTCAPVAWRIAPVALLSGSTGATPGASGNSNPNTSSGMAVTSLPPAPVQRLSIEINGTILPVQLGNPIEVEVKGERVRIVVTNARP